MEEQRRFLRGVDAYELDRLQGLLEGLIAVDVAAAGGGDAGESAVLDAIVAHPVLMERPIVVRGKRAEVGRPPENVLRLLE